MWNRRAVISPSTGALLHRLVAVDGSGAGCPRHYHAFGRTRTCVRSERAGVVSLSSSSSSSTRSKHLTMATMATANRADSIFTNNNYNNNKIFQQKTRAKNNDLTMMEFSSSPSLDGLKESYENILVNVQEDDSIATITLHRPKQLNALSDGLLQDLLHATKVLNDSSPSIRCIVITGSEKAFSAGADIKEMSSKSFEQVYSQDMFAEWQDIIMKNTPNVPLIAAVSGYCLGGGCELAMMCDIVVCNQTAKFGQPEITLGVIPGAGGTQRLTRAVGKSKSMLMNLTGTREYYMSADEAYRSNLVAKVYPTDDYDTFVADVQTLAKQIASNGAIAIQAVKEAVLAADELSLSEGLRLERRLFHSMFATDDQKEGMAAFLERRPAEFK